MTFTITIAIFFVIVLLLLGVFALYLSLTIEDGEARFDSSGRMISDAKPVPDETTRPARRID